VLCIIDISSLVACLVRCRSDLPATLQEAQLTEEILAFPPEFRWGCATAAHQVEGSNTNNDWHAWEAAGNAFGGQTAGKAYDWWTSAESDLKIASAMGQNAHRMSVEWSRIEPREGVWDTAAIDRYRAILQCMRGYNLEPMVTLHHFTTPVWLPDRGGWENPAIIHTSNVSRKGWHVLSGNIAICGSPSMSLSLMPFWAGMGACRATAPSPNLPFLPANMTFDLRFAFLKICFSATPQRSVPCTAYCREDSGSWAQHALHRPQQ